MRRLVRPLAALILAALVISGVSRGPGPRATMTREAAALLADGAAWADSVVAATRSVSDPAALATSSVVALGYLERQRVGLGSPFRLIELALTDTRLKLATRRRLAWALMDRARRGQSASIDARALEPASTTDASSMDERVRAKTHVALIERGIRRAGDPRAGELAVRLAYSLASAEGTVASGALARALRVAAIARDRAMVQSDVQRLLGSARRMGTDPLAMLPVWRQERWFASERPPASDGLGPDRSLIEQRALAIVAPLLDSIRTTISRAPSPVLLPAVEAPLLGDAAARRLAAIAATAAPPMTPVVVSLRAERASLPEETWINDLLARARNEETLVAVHALLAHRNAVTPAIARVVLDAAVAMRALAQEPVWHPGMGSADARSAAASLGLLAIEFDNSVPASWHPYYLNMLATSVEDLKRVLPDVTLDGLRVRFAAESPGGGALAIHEPRSRTIVFPVETAAGTIAHELAHDLDWQAARAMYHKRGTYSTDLAVLRHDSRLASSLRGMTAARLIAPGASNNYRPPHHQRPAEVFARNVDWFVVASLAREGRSNGYLSAVQDESLTGYASVLPREVGGRGGSALVDALEEMAYVSESSREWFLEHWGTARARRPAGIVRQAMSLSTRRVSQPVASMRGAASGLAIDAAVREAMTTCRDVSGADEGSSAELAWLAVESRARGIVKSRANAYRESARPAWANAALGVAPWAPTLADDVVRRVRTQLLVQLHRGVEMAGPFEVGELPPIAAACE